MLQEASNKSIIRDFYRRALGQGDIAFAEEIIADDYIQHSPALKPGKAGVIEAIQYMKQMPKPTTTATPFMRLIADGEYVVTNMRFGWSGKQKVVVDLFRFQSGKVAEHWDAVDDQPETSLNGNAMMDGAVDIDDVDLTARNKEIAGAFYQRVFVDRYLEALPDFVATDLIQHMPDIANGINGLRVYLHQQPARQVHRLVGEGNYVVIQSEGQVDQQPTLFYDIFRLSTGKIVEQWGVKRILPKG